MEDKIDIILEVVERQVRGRAVGRRIMMNTKLSQYTLHHYTSSLVTRDDHLIMEIMETDNAIRKWHHALHCCTGTTGSVVKFIKDNFLLRSPLIRKS